MKCIDCNKKCQGKRCFECRNKYFKTEEHKKIRSKANKGKIAWNKNKKFVHSGSFKKGHKGYSEKGVLAPNWKGGLIINSQGYIEIYSLNDCGYILQHRKIVQDFIKRPLLKTEIIHHIDENKTNNNINNLMIFKNPNAHKSFHNKIKQFGFTTPIKRQIDERWKNYQINPFFS
jgi:hypothetical protein